MTASEWLSQLRECCWPLSALSFEGCQSVLSQAESLFSAPRGHVPVYYPAPFQNALKEILHVQILLQLLI